MMDNNFEASRDDLSVSIRKHLKSEECGKPNAHAHHEDYSQPLLIKWLCPEHHGIIHRIYP
jgi:hypothetical protein